MFRKIVDVLKEVFWIKTPPTRKRAAGGRKSSSKRPAKKKAAPAKARKAAPKAPLRSKPAAKPAKPIEKPKVPAVKKPAKQAVIDPSLTEAGIITHYFDRIKVSVVKVTEGTILIGDKLTIVGEKVKFIQKVWSMQIESEDVKVAKKGQVIGLKVDKIVAVGDKVYK